MSHARRSFFRQEEAATAVEYGVMVALIAATVVIAVIALGRSTEAGMCAPIDQLDAVGVNVDRGPC